MRVCMLDFFCPEFIIIIIITEKGHPDWTHSHIHVDPEKEIFFLLTCLPFSFVCLFVYLFVCVV